MRKFLLFSIFVLSVISSVFPFEDDFEDGIFLAKITTIDENDAHSIGRKHGFEVERKLQSYDDVYIGKRLRRRKRAIEDEIIAEMLLSQQVQFIEKLHGFRRFKRASIPSIKRTSPVHVWNLLPSMGIREAWEDGYNASKVTVAVIDDGVDVEHVDLQNAFSPDVSFDFVRFGELPIPKKTKETQHGTQCAGLVSMEGHRCGLGVGHGARLGAIRLLGQDYLNDALEGDALAFQKHQVSFHFKSSQFFFFSIDIYSISWGPKDDGKTAEKPTKFTQEAIKNGAIHGRNEKGNIYVWASGNGGTIGDNCALDGYVNNEYTMSFGVVDSSGFPAYYAEGCSSVLAAVSGGDAQIQTTGFDSTCSVISGSSASAAIASGILALVLEANPLLTRRDIEHLIIYSSNSSAIQMDFQINSAGLKFHPNVGFGLLDARKMVENAKKWINVEEQKKCQVESLSSGIIDFSKCSEVSRIERVILHGSVIHPNRGQVRIHLESPSGTSSELLPLRPIDSSADLLDWDFVSVHFFGENPKGVWKLHIISETDVEFRVQLKSLRITGV